MHSVEGLGFAKVLSHIIGQLFQLLMDLSHELLAIIKVPLKKNRIDLSLFGFVRITILQTNVNVKLPSSSLILCCSSHQYHSCLDTLCRIIGLDTKS